MRLKMLVIAVLPVIAIAVVASAFGGGQSELSSLRQATAKYHDLQSAIEAGYITELPQTAAFGGGTCIANGAEGAMGIHMLDTRRPERRASRRNARSGRAGSAPVREAEQRDLKLTGVEYIVAGGAQPELYGQDFADTNLARFGNPGANVWTLHAWVWKPNPDGMFDPWNTRVTC